nr:hypothetical protein [Oscillospiraceae bacterium]
MTARFATASSSFRSTAAACSPARIYTRLDTALLLAVSICVLHGRIILPLF